MTPEEGSNQTNEPSAADVSTGPVGGERLADARRARGVSVREIAKELHLDEPKVRALEQNRFEVLGAPVFAKGHMRKYAELVGVPIDDVLADYYQLNRSVGAPPVVGPPRKVSRDISIGPWLAVVVALIVGAATWWWFRAEPASEPVSVQAPAPLEAESLEDRVRDVADEAPSAAVEEITEAFEEPAGPLIEVVPEPEADLVSVEDSADVESGLTGNNVELVLTYSGDCWTEVTDAAGRRLFFDLGTDGRTVTLNGIEPLGVLLGNSANVAVSVDGFDYTIPAANRRGNTARLTIYGQ